MKYFRELEQVDEFVGCLATIQDYVLKSQVNNKHRENSKVSVVIKMFPKVAELVPHLATDFDRR